MFDKIIGVLAPHTCLICHTEGSLLCEWCEPDAVAPLPNRCYRCFKMSQDSTVCSKCRRVSPLRYVWVRSQYETVAKELIYHLKFGRARAAARTITELLDDAVPALSSKTVITYVPTATRRVRMRGYDQSKLIARAFAQQRNLPFQTLLVRHGQTRQVGADRNHRQKQAANNYQYVGPAFKDDTEILLIDDITTTGATLESAARILKKAGAVRVNAATFAQKQ